MSSKAESRRGRRLTLLDELRATHKPNFDAVDGGYWGCICEANTDCLLVGVLTALNEAEQEIIRLSKDLKKECDSHTAEIRKITSELAGLEIYNRRLKEENDALQQKLDNGVS